ncbi:unnamed protein product [Acanthoscelides obtectus]|uniref:DDB1-and CUL4-associated factor 8 n=1 Tax=Acanthoscelides obtectus TaxID=200917 RepID=A0A9P0PZM6_ACAOB|nr:unnamed protein product [Acanthoscelides obtectus]CAK1659242.1 DDB1- and CUL4-associated factor 8 [Acanthoscelides obtectus]
MDEDDGREKQPDSTDSPEKAKRFKSEQQAEGEQTAVEKSEESSSSSNNTEQESASTSSDSGFPRSRNSRNRSYRRSNEDNSDNHSSAEEDGVLDEDEDHEEEIDDDDDSSGLDDGSTVDLFSSSSSDSTVIHDSDQEVNDEVNMLLLMPKPKHNWFVVPEVINRQIGYRTKMQRPELFMRRCYGSLHCVQRMELMYKLEEHEGCVNCLNFHPHGTLLASGSDDHMVCLWDWKVARCVLKYDTLHRSNVFQSKFLHLSGDLHVATCARDGHVRLAQINNEGVRDNRKLGSHKGACHKLAVMVDQPHIILSAGEDGDVLRHDVRKNKPESLVNIKGEHKSYIIKNNALYSIHANPMRTTEFCVSGRHEQIRVYDQRKPNVLVNFYQPPTRPKSSVHATCAVYNWDGSEILGTYTDDTIYLFDQNCEPGQYIHKYRGHRNMATIKGVNFFGPKSEFIVSGSDCGNLYFWESNTEAIVQWVLADDKRVVS